MWGLQGLGKGQSSDLKRADATWYEATLSRRWHLSASASHSPILMFSQRALGFWARSDLLAEQSDLLGQPSEQLSEPCSVAPAAPADCLSARSWHTLCLATSQRGSKAAHKTCLPEQLQKLVLCVPSSYNMVLLTSSALSPRLGPESVIIVDSRRINVFFFFTS